MLEDFEKLLIIPPETVISSWVKFAVASQRVQDLEGAMLNLGKNAGFGADSLEKFRDATNGTVTDTELLTNANIKDLFPSNNDKLDI